MTTPACELHHHLGRDLGSRTTFIERRNRPPARAAILRTGLFVLSLVAVGAAGAARAHDAPQGWHYPFSCCSGHDCRPMPIRAISERPEGYVIGTTGEVVGYADRRVRYSPDGEYHWCSVAGKDDGRTICLFVPPRFF